MRTRTDKISYRSAHVDARLTLREAHSLGTVLAAVEGDGGREAQARAFGQGLLEVARTLSPATAELIAEMVACNADPRTETGKTALALCDGLRAAADLAHRAGAANGYGQWTEVATNPTKNTKGETGNVGATRESPAVAQPQALPSSTDAKAGGN